MDSYPDPRLCHQLTPLNGRSWWMRFFLQFHNPLIYILLGAGRDQAGDRRLFVEVIFGGRCGCVPGGSETGFLISRTWFLMILFDFDSEAACNLWVPVNDVVMGGVSCSRFDHVGESTAVFSGTVSLENSGGFASIRSTPSSYDLRTYTGLLLRVRGDGKQYKMNLKTEAALDGVQYQAVFKTEAGAWTEILIPFSKFAPTFRGVHAHDSPPLDTGSIRSFGFLISDRQEGPFRLVIDRISAYP